MERPKVQESVSLGSQIQLGGFPKRWLSKRHKVLGIPPIREFITLMVMSQAAGRKVLLAIGVAASQQEYTCTCDAGCDLDSSIHLPEAPAVRFRSCVRCGVTRLGEHYPAKITGRRIKPLPFTAPSSSGVEY